MASRQGGLGCHRGHRRCRLGAGKCGGIIVMENLWFNVIYSVTPTILIGLVFWFIMRSIIRADRTERHSFQEIERQERQKRGLPVDDLLDQREEDRLPNS